MLILFTTLTPIQEEGTTDFSLHQGTNYIIFDLLRTFPVIDFLGSPKKKRSEKNSDRGKSIKGKSPYQFFRITGFRDLFLFILIFKLEKE